jgi:hypothetical protein
LRESRASPASGIRRALLLGGNKRGHDVVQRLNEASSGSQQRIQLSELVLDLAPLLAIDLAPELGVELDVELLPVMALELALDLALALVRAFRRLISAVSRTVSRFLKFVF